jgi:hypothetical protein
MKSILTHIHAAQEWDAMSHQEGLWIEIHLLEIRLSLRNVAAKIELLANFCYLNHSGNYLLLAPAPEHLSWSPCRELASYRSCMTSLLQYECCFLLASRRSLAEELDLSSSFIKNFILTLDQCCLID